MFSFAHLQERFLSAATTPNPYPCVNMTVLYGYDLPAFDFANANVANYTACCTLCLATATCVAFTYVLSGTIFFKNCFLKNGITSSSANSNECSAHY